MDRNFIQKLLIGIFAVACLIFGVNLFTSSEYGQAQTQNDKLEVRRGFIIKIRIKNANEIQ